MRPNGGAVGDARDGRRRRKQSTTTTKASAQQVSNARRGQALSNVTRAAPGIRVEYIRNSPPPHGESPPLLSQAVATQLASPGIASSQTEHPSHALHFFPHVEIQDMKMYQRFDEHTVRMDAIDQRFKEQDLRHETCLEIC